MPVSNTQEDHRNLYHRDEQEYGRVRKCAHEVSWLRPLNLAPNYTGLRFLM